MIIENEFIKKINDLKFNEDNICTINEDDYIFVIKINKLTKITSINVYKSKHDRYELTNYNSKNFSFFSLELYRNSFMKIIKFDKDNIIEATYNYNYNISTIYIKSLAFYENRELIFDKPVFMNSEFITDILKYRDMKKESNKKIYFANGNLYSEHWKDQKGNDIKKINYHYYEEINKKPAIKSEYYFKNNDYHNDKGAAIINYDIEGNITKKIFYKNGKIINDGPVPGTVNFRKGKVNNTIFFDEEENYNRENFPAFYFFNIDYDKKYFEIEVNWIKNDNLHNKNGPAIIIAKNGSINEEYYIQGEKINDELAIEVIRANETEIVKKIRKNLLKFTENF